MLIKINKKSKNPLVSVIMSVYNEEKHVKKAIESILNQTYRNIEVIVIDDYSTDNSMKIIESINDVRIKIHKKTIEKKYLSTSRNIGIKMAKGDYILLHDADDTCSPDRIRIQLNKAMELNCEAVIGCFVNKIFADGHIESVKLPIEHADIIKGFTKIRNRATIVSGTILAQKSIFNRFNYNENLKYAQDWDHMLKMFESGVIKFYNIPEFIYNYYQHPKNVVNKVDWPDYNILIRINQKRRLSGKKEIKDLDELKRYLKSEPTDFIFWSLFKILIKANLLFKKIVSN